MQQQAMIAQDTCLLALSKFLVFHLESLMFITRSFLHLVKPTDSTRRILLWLSSLGKPAKTNVLP